MKKTHLVLIIMLLFTMVISGCYTKFYRPGMEQQAFATDRIYNPNDSTAIDTTLTKDDSGGSSYYPNNEDRWYYWGRPRGMTRWGFDFDNYSPGYYWTYEGYYDYYSNPWWSNSYNNGWWNPYYNGNGSGTPSEPPSRRGGDRGRIGDGGGSYAQPSGGGGGSYATPAPPPAAAPPKDTDNTTKSQDTPKSDPNKRSGGRGR